jgi:hypothetical protein
VAIDQHQGIIIAEAILDVQHCAGVWWCHVRRNRRIRLLHLTAGPRSAVVLMEESATLVRAWCLFDNVASRLSHGLYISMYAERSLSTVYTVRCVQQPWRRGGGLLHVDQGVSFYHPFHHVRL